MGASTPLICLEYLQFLISALEGFQEEGKRIQILTIKILCYLKSLYSNEDVLNGYKQSAANRSSTYLTGDLKMQEVSYKKRSC